MQARTSTPAAPSTQPQVEPVSETTFDAYVTLRNLLVPGPPTTRQELEFYDALSTRRRWLACGPDGEPVGIATIADWVEYGPHCWSVSVHVRREHVGMGVRRALAAAARAELRTRGAETIFVDERDTHVEAVEFWRSRGFTVIEQHPEVELEIAGAHLEETEGPAGLTITTLADRPQLERDVYEMSLELWSDEPSELELESPMPWEQWHRVLHGSDRLSPALLWLAHLDGRLAGLLQLGRHDGLAWEAWHSFTGVARWARGRGIALALKAHVIRQAPALGITRLRTSNHERNAPMRHINRRLGYRFAFTTLILRREGLWEPQLDELD